MSAQRSTCDTPAEVLRGLLPDLSERTAAQLLDLHRYPTPERAERLAIELDGVRMLALRLRQALILEGRVDGPQA